MRRPGRTSFQDCDKLEATFVKSVHIREPSNLRFTETAAFFAHFHQIIMTVANCRTITIPIDSNISRTRWIIIYTGSWEWILNNNKTSVCPVALKVRFFIQKTIRVEGTKPRSTLWYWQSTKNDELIEITGINYVVFTLIVKRLQMKT